jgi:hypothetical protein
MKRSLRFLGHLVKVVKVRGAYDQNIDVEWGRPGLALVARRPTLEALRGRRWR